jgi:hypothetical protein
MRRVLPGPIPELDTAALHQVDALVEDLDRRRLRSARR